MPEAKPNAIQALLERRKSMNTGPTGAPGPAPMPAPPEDWEWNCSKEVRKKLEDMGLYETMRQLVYTISYSDNARALSVARLKMESMTKVMTVLKNATAVSIASGADKGEGRIREITISLKRDEEEDGPTAG